MSRRDDSRPFRYRHAQSSLSDWFYLVVLVGAALALLLLTPLVRVLPPLFLGALLVIGVHEAGHVLAGRLNDFRCPVVKIGPFEIARKYGQWSIRYAGGWWDGAAYGEPLHTFNMRRREALFVAGGPAASYAFMLLLWGLSLLLDPYHTGGAGSPWKDACANALQTLAVASGAAGTFNLIPFRYGEFHSDGARLLGLLRETLQARRRW